MQKTIQFLENELKKIEATDVSTKIIRNIRVNYFGVSTPIGDISLVFLQNKQVIVKPRSIHTLSLIDSSIKSLKKGFKSKKDTDCIKVDIPPLTSSEKQELIKSASDISEKSKISIRKIRRNIINEKNSNLSQDSIKQMERETQRLTEQFIKQIDVILKKKIEEIMKL